MHVRTQKLSDATIGKCKECKKNRLLPNNEGVCYRCKQLLSIKKKSKETESTLEPETEDS